MTYGCYNRKPYKPTLWVQNGWFSTGARVMVEVPFVMSKECQYTTTELGQKDSGCIGCEWQFKIFKPKEQSNE